MKGMHRMRPYVRSAVLCLGCYNGNLSRTSLYPQMLEHFWKLLDHITKKGYYYQIIEIILILP